VKRREGWSFARFSGGKPSPVWGWWLQCLGEAAEEDRIPMLCVRKNRQPWMFLLPERVLVPVLVRVGQSPDLTFQKLDKKIDYGDILPAMVFGEKFLAIDPHAWIKRIRGSRRTPT